MTEPRPLQEQFDDLLGQLDSNIGTLASVVAESTDQDLKLGISLDDCQLLASSITILGQILAEGILVVSETQTEDPVSEHELKDRVAALPDQPTGTIE